MLASLLLALQLQGMIGFGYALDDAYDVDNWQRNITGDFRVFQQVFYDKTDIGWVHRSAAYNGFDGDPEDRDIAILRYRMTEDFGTLAVGAGVTLFRTEDQGAVIYGEYTYMLSDTFYLSLSGSGGFRSKDNIDAQATFSTGALFTLF